MPTIKEIRYCLKHKLVSDKDLILYHVVIQMHLQKNEKEETYKCAKNFYKLVSQA